MFAVDWAVKKKLRIYDSKKDKLTTIGATIEEFRKFLKKQKNHNPFYFEEGGGDSFKLLAYRNGDPVFTIPGKKTKDLREELKIEKSDEADAMILGLIAKNKPDEFYKFNEADILTCQIKLTFRNRCTTEQNMVREKLRLFALKNQVELLNLDGYKGKLLEQKEGVIKSLQAEFEGQTKTLDKLVKKHPYWRNYFKEIKGIGPAVAGGLIAEINIRNTSTKYDLCSYAGMKKKKGNQNFNHKLKRCLYFFADGIIKHRTPVWRDLYDNIKVYYREKHSNWSKGKVENYTRKFVQTKFLIEVYKRMKGIK